MKRQLILENGTVFIGDAIGANVDTVGEVVFNTGMTGYQEVLSDPSYCGQIVTFTYPLVGNYGINRDDFESISPSVQGVVVKEACGIPSNWRKEKTLDEFLTEKNIPGIAGIDTRKLTRLIRQYGTVKGTICGVDVQAEEMIEKLAQIPLPTDQVQLVSTKAAYASPGLGERIVVVDFGMKHGILRELSKRGCDVVVVPYDTTADQIMELAPDGVMLSNGPGDPKDVPEAISMIKEILGRVPLFGICLGHQLFALACGANTVKMSFGHRGSNHPVKELRSGKVAITSQNHGYTVEKESLTHTPLEMTHIAINDGTVEGLKHLTYPAFTVQYHPEASPGPEDANGLFDEFLLLINHTKQEKDGANQCQNVLI